MITLTDKIIDTWSSTLDGGYNWLKLQDGYYAYIIRGCAGEIIVAVPCMDETPTVNEEFNAVQLKNVTYSLTKPDGSVGNENLLCLQFNGIKPARPFAALCAEFIDPGLNGDVRSTLLKNPTAWWKTWKELLGNKNVDPKVYDVLGELETLLLLHRKGAQSLDWRGPETSSYDIHTVSGFYEVKSTIVRENKQVQLHNRFQCDAGTAKLSIILCVFEPASVGKSINDLVQEVISAGIMNENEVEMKLSALNYEKGKSARNRKYLLHTMEEYEVDDNFPKLDHLPPAVVDVEMVLDLAAFKPKPLM